MTQIQAAAADSFVDSIGVVTALGYTDTAYYQQWPLVLSALKALGVRHVRDGYTTSPLMMSRHDYLKAAGIGVHAVIPYDASRTVADIEEFASWSGNIESLEYPNEMDAAVYARSPHLHGVSGMRGGAALLHLADAAADPA